MIFRIADDSALPAVGSYHVTLRHSFRGVIRSFRMNIRLECEQELFDCRLLEDSHVINRLESRHDFGTLYRRQDWSTGAFLNGDLLIGGNADDYYAAQRFGPGEVTTVPNVQHAETAVREDDARAGLPGVVDTLN